MKDTFASRGLAHRYKKKPEPISREEVNKATQAFLKRGGNIEVLTPEGHDIHQKLTGNHDARSYSWTFNAIRRTGIVNQEQEEFKY